MELKPEDVLSPEETQRIRTRTAILKYAAMTNTYVVSRWLEGIARALVKDLVTIGLVEAYKRDRLD
jgi:hypothetical protein